MKVVAGTDHGFKKHQFHDLCTLTATQQQ